MDTRWRNLFFLVVVAAVLVGIAQWVLSSNVSYLPLVFSSSQLSDLGSGLGPTDAQRMEAIRDGFQIMDKETGMAVTQGDFHIKPWGASQWALMIPGLKAGRDYTYVITIDGFAPMAGEILEVQPHELQSL